MQEADNQLDFNILDNGILVDNYEDTMCPVKKKLFSRGITKPIINKRARKQKRKAQKLARKVSA